MVQTLAHDSSFAADSTMSSPSPSPEPKRHRAPVTYSRRKDVASTVAGDLSLPQHDEEIVPDSEECRPPPDTSPMAADEDSGSDADDNESDAAPITPYYSWKQQLADIDQADDDDDALAGRTLLASDSHSPERPPLYPPSDVHAPIPSQSDDTLFGGSLPSLTESSSQGSSLSRSSPPPFKALRSTRIPDSSPQTSPVFPPVTTPNDRSSPTPPTSDSDSIPMAMKKGKGKAQGKTARLVPPLSFEQEESLPLRASRRPMETRKGKEKKTNPVKKKRPTKKELREAQLETARLNSDTRVTLEKTTRPLELGQLLRNTLPQKAHQSVPSTSSDPIESFSSPAITEAAYSCSRSTSPFIANSLLSSASIPTPAEDADPFRPTSLLGPQASIPSLGEDSDSEDMPETFSEMVQARQTARSRAQEEARRKEELKLRKLAYLDERKQHATTSMYKAGPDALVLSDESDEDLVVEDTMQVVAREEAANRLKRSPPKKGAEVQRKFAAKSPRKGGLPPSPEKVAKFLTEAAQPSFSLGKSKTTRPTMDLKDLNRVLLTKAESVGEKVRRDKEQEWERRGHTVSRVLAPAKDNPMEQLLGKALERRNRDVPMDEDEDADDEDWVPEERGSASPEPPDAPDDEYAENLPEDRDDNPMVDGQDADLEDDAEILPPVVRGRAHRRAIADSDGESDDDAENAAPPPPSHGTVMSSFPPSPSFPSPSPMPDVETELELGNETDKENMKDRMFDRGEDKENKAVARHRLFGSALAMDDDDELPSPARLFQSPPLEDDPFSFSQTPVKEKQAALTRLRSPLPSLALSPAFGKKGKGRAGLSQFFDDDAGAEVEGGGFGDVFASGSSPSKQTQNLEGLKMDLGGLSQAFEQTQDKISFDVLRRDTTEFSLTLDAQALQPALEVDDHLLQKAAQIFEKEQEYLLDAAQPVAAKKHKPQLYVNDNGFLTQTRPDVASPELYRPSPSQPAHVFSIFRQTQASQSVLGSVQRKPLGTLAVDDVDETPSHKPLRRLRRAGDSPIGGLHAVGGYRSSPSPSPSPMRKLNAFDALQAGAQRAEKAKKRQLGRSEFVEAEAEESDEDDMLGFGGVRKKGADDDDDEDGDDKEVEGLMDDAEMSEDAIAREKVMEKHQEHQEEDDARLEKIARDAIEGKLRTKRRSGVGLGDSDSEDDEDEHAREQRRRMAKKRKIHDDELEDLAKQPETMPFYNTYHHGLVDDGTEFAHLQQDDLMADDSDTENVEAGPRETVSAADIRKELQVMAQQKQVVEHLDPDNVQWVDQDNSDDEHNIKIREVERAPGKRPVDRRIQPDFDEPMNRPARTVETEEERLRLQRWRKEEGSSFNVGNTGRGGAGASVTALGKSKSAGARPGARQRNSGASGSGSGSAEPRRPVQKAASMLSAVSSRKERFGTS